MSRNFPNFVDAYLDYVSDNFVPSKFHMWTAISVLSGAMERKTYIPWSETLRHYPNLYIMLVAKPGIGKSSAIKPGVDLLKSLDGFGQTVNVLPEQMTEAKFISLMSKQQTYEAGGKQYFQNNGYFAASEASNSLKNVYGDFIACLTDFYDCPVKWVRATMKHGDSQSTINNGCLSVIAGCTFEYLGKLINSDSIQGGFASRFIYVIQTDNVVRKSQWQKGASEKSSETRMKLIEDLAHIGKMQGAFVATDAFQEKWNSWFPAFDKYRQNLRNESMQSLLVRKSTNLLKLCMIFSAAESSNMVMDAHHWERAMTLLDSMQDDLPSMMTKANATKTDTQEGLNAALKINLGKGGMTREKLQGLLTYQYNFKPYEVINTIDSYINSGVLILSGGNKLRLVGDLQEEVRVVTPDEDEFTVSEHE